MKFKIGPAGIGKVKDVEKTFSEYKREGITAAEIPFTYGVYIKTESEAKKVNEAAKKNDIQLSVHAPYWINLNSQDPEKVKASKKRILDCLKVGTWLDAKIVVFHPGFYGKANKEKSYEKIKDEILDLQKIREANNYTPKLAPETMGKINVFGSAEDIARLVRDTQCSFCVDFAHILARDRDYSFERIKKLFGEHDSWHVHFSGIEYGEKGEKKHVLTPKEEIKKVIENLPKNKEIVIINEAPNPVGDSIKTIKIFRKKFLRH